jgi:hypothetical protein
MLSEIWVWDSGFEIRDPRPGIRDPGKPILNLEVEKAKDPGPGSSTLHMHTTGTVVTFTTNKT